MTRKLIAILILASIASPAVAQTGDHAAAQIVALRQDGAAAKAEFIAASKAHFEAADADGDGNVTPWEMRSANWN